MKVNINRQVGDQSYVVGIGDGMTISIISVLRSDFRSHYIKNCAKMTGYLDELEFQEKHRAQSLTQRAQALALFRDQCDEARRVSYLETCVTDWDVKDENGDKVPFSIAALKSVFLAEENKHQIDDLLELSSREQLFWLQLEREAEEELKK